MINQPLNRGDEDSELLPATFADNADRDWNLRLDFVRLRVIRDFVGLDFGDAKNMGRTWADLLLDDSRALDAIWVAMGGTVPTAVNPEVERKVNLDGTLVELDDWLGQMDGPALGRARAALWDAILNFTQPEMRRVLQIGIEKVNAGYLKTIREAERKVATEMDAAIGRATKAARHGTPLPKSPASSARSTTTGRSGKRTRP